MTYKHYEERLKGTFDLEKLCVKAGYESHSEVVLTSFPLNEDSSLLERVARGIIIDRQKDINLKDLDEEFKNIFLRLLGEEGVEIFYFRKEHVWQQVRQESRKGLVYFCLPNKERLEHEKDYTLRFKRTKPALKKAFRRDKEGLKYTIPLNIDVMYPDKWSHMALEILLRQANYKK